MSRQLDGTALSNMGDTLEEEQTPSEQEDRPDAAPETMKNDAKVQREMQNSTSTESIRYDHSDVIVHDSILYRVSKQLSCETLFRFAFHFLNLTIVDIENASDIVPRTVYEKVAKSFMWWTQNNSRHNAGRLKKVFKKAVGHGLLEKQVLDKTQEWKDNERLSNAHVNRIALVFTPTSWKDFTSQPYLKIPDHLKAFEASENKQWFHLQSVGILKIWKNTPPAKTIGDLLDVLKKGDDEGVVPRAAIDVIDSNYARSEITDSMSNCSEPSEPEKETLNLPVESTEEKIKRMGLESHRKNTTRNPRLNTRGSSHTRYEVHDSPMDVTDAASRDSACERDQSTAISEQTVPKQFHAGRSNQAGSHNQMRDTHPSGQSGVQNTDGAGSHNNQEPSQPSSDREQAAAETEQDVDPADQQNTGEHSDLSYGEDRGNCRSADVSSHATYDSGVGFEPDVVSKSTKCKQLHAGKSDRAGPHNLMNNYPNGQSGKQHTGRTGSRNNQRHGQPSSDREQAVTETEQRVDPADQQNTGENSDTKGGNFRPLSRTNMSHEGKPEDNTMTECGLNGESIASSDVSLSYSKQSDNSTRQQVAFTTSATMLKIRCPVDGCHYEASDVEAVIIAALLNAHATTHAARNQTPHQRVEKVKRPTVFLAGTQEDWTYFTERWSDYKKATNLTGDDVTIQLLECCDEELRSDLTRSSSSKLSELTETKLLEAMRSLAVREQNMMVSRLLPHQLRQDHDSSYGEDGENCRDQPNQESELRVVCTEPDKGITRESSTSPSLQLAKHLSDSTNSMSKQNSTSIEPARPKRQRYKSLKKLFCCTIAGSSDSEHTQYYKNRPTNREPNS